MNVHSLYSSSDGNACRVFDDNTSVLIDCGVSDRKLFAHGKFNMDAIAVTHDHSDHMNNIGTVGRRTGTKIVMPEKLFNSINDRFPGSLEECRIESLPRTGIVQVGSFTLKAIRTSHDSGHSVFYTIRDLTTGLKFGLLTDTGMYSAAIIKELNTCDAMILETNYDERLIDDYQGYPTWHKVRIRSTKGHLSNQQTLKFIKKHLNLDKVKWIGFGHVSPRTNDKSLLLSLFKREFPRYSNFFVVPTTAPRSIK